MSLRAPSHFFLLRSGSPLPMSTILDQIKQFKLTEVAARKRRRSLEELQRIAERKSPPRGFKLAIDAQICRGRPAVIAEMKRCSPSKGVLREDYVPVDIAAAYALGGATCLSVLTDHEFFGGDDIHVRDARKGCSLPVLRKEFVVDAYQIVESRALGADCVLLILAMIDDDLAAQLEKTAHALGMDVIAETHTPEEMQRALGMSCGLIGVNNRDLHTFEVSLEISERLRPLVPDGRTMVSESGLTSSADLARLMTYDVGAFLVGESLMRQQDLATAMRSLIAVPASTEADRARLS